MIPKDSSKVADAESRFVLEWGRMSSSWGINRTMAQIHAYMLVKGNPVTVEDLIEDLHISRGNASMNLRDLIDWGIIRRIRRPGERKDLYQCDGDVFHMFARVIRERKRRELDPAVDAIRECLAMVPDNDKDPEAESFRVRLSTLLMVFDAFDKVYQQVFASDQSFQQTIELLMGDPASFGLPSQG
jgi:DNA-binding transcriptional regulator GbsR (MarR family)